MRGGHYLKKRAGLFRFKNNSEREVPGALEKKQKSRCFQQKKKRERKKKAGRFVEVGKPINNLRK